MHKASKQQTSDKGGTGRNDKDEQEGFREGYGHILVLYLIHKYVHNLKSSSYMLFLDFRCF